MSQKYEGYVEKRRQLKEQAEEQVASFDEEFKSLLERRGIDNLERPKFSWRKFCLVCPCCGGILKVKQKNYAKRIIEYSHMHSAGNYNQIFYCSCGYRYAKAELVVYD